MKTLDIRQKLHHYIEPAQDKKVKGIYTMVEEEIQEPYDYWNDKEFLSELRRRQEAYKSGQTKTHTLQEALKKIRASLDKKSK
jgi:hypothetical protein